MVVTKIYDDGKLVDEITADYRWMWMVAKRRLMLAAAGKTELENIGIYAAQDALRLLDEIEQCEFFGSDWEQTPDDEQNIQNMKRELGLMHNVREEDANDTV